MCDARKPRRRRHDALANAGRIDADHRRVLEDARPCPPRQRGKTMDIFAAVDLKRLRIIHAVEIAIGLELIAHAIDLPSLHFRLEILAEHLQPADQLIAGLDIGYFKGALAHGDARHRFFRRGGPDVFGALLRQRPEFAGVLESDTCDQLADRKTVTRHHRAELMTGCIPADVPAFENGDAGAQPCCLQRHRQAGKACAYDGDVDIQIERKPRTLLHRGGIRSAGRACGSLAHIVFLRTDRALVTLSSRASLYINLQT